MSVHGVSFSHESNILILEVLARLSWIWTPLIVTYQTIWCQRTELENHIVYTLTWSNNKIRATKNFKAVVYSLLQDWTEHSNTQDC
jgi:hypothetical protein